MHRRRYNGNAAAACTGGQCAWAELHRIAGMLEDTRPAVGLQALGERAGCHSCGDSQAILQGAWLGVRGVASGVLHYFGSPKLSLSTETESYLFLQQELSGPGSGGKAFSRTTAACWWLLSVRCEKPGADLQTALLCSAQLCDATFTITRVAMHPGCNLRRCCRRATWCWRRWLRLKRRPQAASCCPLLPSGNQRQVSACQMTARC